MGYLLHRPFWNQGYATRAGERLLAYAFHDLGLDSLIAPIRPENEASRRVADRLGFVAGECLDYKEFAHIIYERQRAP